MDKWDVAAKFLLNGQVAVIPTDTIYGIVGQALKEDTVRRIHKIKGRSANKPFIVLVSSTQQLQQLGVANKWLKLTYKYWPGPNSLIFPVKAGYEYLTLGTKSLAIRMPKQQHLLNLVAATGPLVAPSANPQAKEPARNIKEAIKYFGDKVDYYLDEGDLNNPPSNLINLITGQILR